MKKSISLILCISIIASVFSFFGITASAAADPEAYFTSSSGSVSNGKVTVKISLLKNASICGAVFRFKYDKKVLKPVAGGGLKTSGSENVPGLYVTGTRYDDTGSYVVGFTTTDAAPVKANTGFIYATFEVIDDSYPVTTLKCYCDDCMKDEKNTDIFDGEAVVFTRKFSTLSVPSGFACSSQIGGIKFSWKAVAGAENYNVYRKTGTGYWNLLATVDASTRSYVDDTAKAGANYTYTARAVNSKGTSGYLSGIKAVFVTAPSNVSVSNSVGGVTVTWPAVSGAAKYTVYRRVIDDSGKAGSWVKLATSGERSYFDKKSLVSGTCYEYGVRSTNKDGDMSGTRVSNPNIYLAVPTFTLSNVYGAVRIKWTKVEGANKYYVYRKLTTAKSWTCIAKVASSVLKYEDTKAVGGMQYYYTVKAVDDINAVNGAFEKKSFTYFASPVPTVSNINSGVNIKWDKIKGASKYLVYRKTADSSWKRIATVTGTSYVDTTAAEGTLYYYTVKAYDGSQYSAYNKDGAAIKYLKAPVLVSAKSSGVGITVKWKTGSFANGYYIYRKLSGGSWKKIAAVKGKTVLSFTDTSAETGKTYLYTVRAYNGKYLSSYDSSGVKCVRG